MKPPARGQQQPDALAAAAPLRDQPPASPNEEMKVADPAKLTKADVAKRPLADQSRPYDSVLGKPEVLQKTRLERINAKSQARLQRRQAKAQNVRQMRPRNPKGLLAALKQSGYQREYDQLARHRLRRPGAGGRGRAARQESSRCEKPLRLLERIDSAFVERVQNHRWLEQKIREQRELVKRELKPVQHDRGRSL